MRVSKGPVVCICGGTCVGKTTVARTVAEAMGWGHRDCGGEIVEAARVRSQPVGVVRTGVHRAVDAETRALAMSKQAVVVEGRYLRYVLVGLETVTIVELTCSQDERGRRSAKRSGNRNSVGVIDESDRRDVELCGELYGVAPREAHLTIDTTELDAAAVAARILRWLGVVKVEEV